ncbi:Sec-independent protein translocase protein TatB [Oligella urethralis]|uniref:Sec-independent protein translocase protein TatB n=1 Tax=Oligella urethralis TaxID=90245 RepID=A0A2X1YIF6_9BURK|nr:Sec-independent protein translocase protein TatB [Oligella urethralis]
MFGLSFSEIIIIALVALIVIGPERLPKTARALGLLMGRAQRYVNDIKSDIEREMHVDDIKSLRTKWLQTSPKLSLQWRVKLPPLPIPLKASQTP